MIQRILFDLFLLSLAVAVLAGIILMGFHKAHAWYRQTEGEALMNYFRRGSGTVVSACKDLINRVKALWAYLFPSQ